ncbi:MAG TPA: cysteine desulfurase [Candidatus Polarisedimenticolaceae bacterium]|nr:cysteine desulfurase [Candidatus Polarisedimenticolaceae bacterium]
MTALPRPAVGRALDLARVRGEFPILARTVHGQPLVYLDNAASTQKPQVVIDAISRFYAEGYANVHRGVHLLSAQATEAYDGVREKVARLIGATDPAECVFVRGTTEGINLVAQTFGRARVRAGDEVLITAMEHHSNLVPWQMLCAARDATLRVLPMTDAGDLRMDELERMLTPRTRLLALVHVSNALGTVNPVRRITEMAHAAGVPVLVDGAQAVARMPVDVRALGCDFYAFSGHKLYGPTGIGVLWGRRELLEAMEPWQGGGDMIRHVTFEHTTYNDVPYKFEAGTPDIAGVIGLGAALDWLQGLGLEAVAGHERALLQRAVATLDGIPEVRQIGTAEERAGLVSFVLEGIHAHDVGTVLDSRGIAVRAGHHCAYPVMERMGVPATVRASFAVYNTEEEIEALAAGIGAALELFRSPR